jgi:hypothetical protein
MRLPLKVVQDLTTTMAMEPLRRLRRFLSQDEGTFLIEALATAAILLTVSAGVVLALQTAHAQTGVQRAKALATDVAQTKLDELRSQAYNDLRTLNTTETVTEGGIDFTVVSTAVADTQSDAPTGCTNSRARDYLRLTTKVDWPERKLRQPVTLTTLVAAPIGAGGGLITSVTGASGQAISGIPITLSSVGSATTDASGCARWDNVSAGTYAQTANVNGYVQPNGDQLVNITGVDVQAEQTATTSFAYDRGGSVSVEFQERTPGSSSATDVDRASLPQDVTLTYGSLVVDKPLAWPSTTATGAAAATGTAGLFYPYPSASYAVFADNCSAAKPLSWPAGTSPSPLPSVIVPAAATAATFKLLLPSLNVKVTDNGSAAPASTVVYVKTACGTLYTNRAVSTTAPNAGLLLHPGMPYGTGFQVCAYNGNSSSPRKGNVTMSNTSFTAPGTSPTTLNMTTSGTCPFTIP